MNVTKVKIIFVIALFLGATQLVLTNIAMAQEPPPPPPPLIYSAPVASDIKEFVSKDAHFSVSFPGNPDKTTAARDQFVLTSYKVKRKGSNSAVTLIEYKESIGLRLESIIENYRRGILDHPLVIGKSEFPSKIIEDKEVSIDGFKGREITYESDLEFTKARILFSANRVYEIKTDVTNWHILTKHYPKKVADFEKEADRFFGSFRILK